MVKKKKYDAFISYSRNDASFVRKLTSKLKRRGVTIFFDEADITVGASLAQTISKAIEDARYVIIIMSPSYFQSLWAKKELELALNHEFEEREVKVIPILIADCEIPPILRTKVYLDLTSKEVNEQSISSILEVFQRDKSQPLALKSRRKKTGAVIGSISERDFESEELKVLVKDLQLKVDKFIEKSENEYTQSQNQVSKVDTKLCFVMMPFGEDSLNDVYDFFIKPTIENECLLVCERGDDVFGSNIVMDDIRRSISKARIVIADLTGRNANVFYEVGIAHTLNKDVLLLSQSMSDVPFDLRHRRILLYEFSPKGCKKLEKSIVNNVNAILTGEV
ncbi:MAG: toll/interleukin-1 receptor domain-containing protein [Bacteroidota bacterium]